MKPPINVRGIFSSHLSYGERLATTRMDEIPKCTKGYGSRQRVRLGTHCKLGSKTHTHNASLTYVLALVTREELNLPTVKLKPSFAQALANWTALNNALREMKDERELRELLNVAIRSGTSVMFVLRIHSRFNRFRGERERMQILQGKGV